MELRKKEEERWKLGLTDLSMHPSHFPKNLPLFLRVNRAARGKHLWLMCDELPPSKRPKQDNPKMEVDTTNLAGRWAPLSMMLSRPTPFGMESGSLQYAEGMEFEADPDLHSEISQACILCVGAGGLGCEILKDLALTGFTNIHVIDLDTIDVTNLNRQFLFRKKDVGKSKAEVAAEFVNRRVPGVKVVPHHGKLQDYRAEWYQQFNIIIAGLDNLEARRWLNQTLCSLVKYEDGEPDPTSIIPLIDGGTEGLKGQARVILPMKTSCFECTMNLFPPARGKAVCTLENNPRVPADCAIYVFMKVDDNEVDVSSTVYGKGDQVSLGDSAAGIILECESSSDDEASERLFRVRVVDMDGLSERSGVPASDMRSIRQHWVTDFGDTKVDKDSREHMTWIHDRASQRAQLFNIQGLTYDKTMGSVKNIIPAVASTNAVIAAACVNEAFKCLTFSGQLCNTYMLYNGQSVGSGVDCNTLQFERMEQCPACSPPMEKHVTVSHAITVSDFVQYLKDKELITPPLDTPLIYDSEGDAFYVTTGPLAAMKASNLSQPLTDFVDNGEVLMVMDSSWGKDVKRNIKVSYA